MRKTLRMLTVFGIVIGFFVSIILVLRFYNTRKYDWGKEEFIPLHDYSNYPDIFKEGTIEHFEYGISNGFHLMPKETINAETIVVFGGSEGKCNIELAKQIAEEGYEVYSLFFFGADNQTETLKKVPLEFFQDFLDYAYLNNEKITVIGSSKGAELSLVLTNYYEEINHLVLYAPSRYVNTGLDFSEGISSSWTWKNKELPYISLKHASFGATIQTLVDMAVLKPVEYRKAYESAVAKSRNRDEALIDVSNIRSQVLLFAGNNDTMWQGDIAVKKLKEELDDKAESVIYDGAGHVFGTSLYGDGFALGGTEKANKKAKIDSDERLMQFLEEYVAK